MGAHSPAACRTLWSGLLLAAAAPTVAPASAASRADACPSPAWISFENSCYALLQGPLETLQTIDEAREFCKVNASGADIISINNKEENTFIQEGFRTKWHGPAHISLGIFFDIDDDVFKWVDESIVNFTNWNEEEDTGEPLNTCATMYTVSGGWKKTSCEHLPLTEILCETTFAYEKKYLPDKTALTTSLVITSTIFVAVAAACLWFLYQRRIYSTSGTTCAVHNSTTQLPYGDEVVLLEEENEYVA